MIAAAIAALATSQVPAGPSGDAVAVVRLAPLGTDPGKVSILTEVLSGEIAKLPGHRLVPPGDLAAAVKAANAEACTGAPVCALSIGRSAGAAKVVTGVVSGFRGMLILNVRALRVADATELNRVEQQIPETDALISAVRQAAYHLLRPDLWVGYLAVDTAPGARVSVDGREAGVTPLPGPVPLKPGASHAVVVTKEGYRKFSHFVDIVFDETLRVKIDLDSSTVQAALREIARPSTLSDREPVPLAAGPTWTRAACLGVLGAAATAAAVAGYFAIQRQAAARCLETTTGEARAACAAAIDPATGQTIVDPATNKPLAAAPDVLVDRVRTSATAANVLFAAAGGAVIAAGVLFFLGSGPSPSAVTLGPGPSLGIAGAF